MTIDDLKILKESEDKVEFKEAKRNFPYNGGSHTDQTERRKCFLGYVVALANEGGGILVFGMSDKSPRVVVGTNFAEGKIGALEDQTYAHLGIRVRLEELYEGSNRVLVTHVPARPVGRLMKFEGVPLMRTGGSLRNMSDEEMFRVLSEQEPDFSATICNGLTLTDLDDAAIQIMKGKYSAKQNNKGFLSLSTGQVLSDLDLMSNGRLTYAALILLGETEVIRRFLPQCRINLEYRIDPASI